MTKSKTTKRAFLASVLSVILCTAFLVASTFAWFTDNASSGKNSIEAGNLDIEMQYWNGDSYQNIDDNKPLFGDEINWEPGTLVYKQIKISNVGSVAAKYSVAIDEDDFAANFVLEPNTGIDSETYPYLGTYRILGDVIQVAVYPGTFKDLVNKVNDQVSGTYKENDRNVVNAAINEGILDSFDYLLGPTDLYHGSLYEGALAPKGTKEPTEITYKTNFDSDETTVSVTDETEFTFIAYWIPDQGMWAEGGAFDEPGFVDDDYNLKNGKKASESTDENDVYDWESEDGTPKKLTADAADSGLYINFSLTAHATQVPYEEDSFGNDYDKDAQYDITEPGVAPPLIG